LVINYSGHAEKWDAIVVSGSLSERNCVVGYRERGRITAVVTIGRDQACLDAEAALARGDQAALEALLRT